MASNQKPRRNKFKALEKTMTKIILGDLLGFVALLFFSSMGIGWLKIIMGILVIVVSAAGDLFLVLIDEHRRPRSHWMLAAFSAMLICTVVSLITGSPAPALS